jgi:hypothetical protein
MGGREEVGSKEQRVINKNYYLNYLFFPHPLFSPLYSCRGLGSPAPYLLPTPFILIVSDTSSDCYPSISQPISIN